MAASVFHSWSRQADGVQLVAVVIHSCCRSVRLMKEDPTWYYFLSVIPVQPCSRCLLRS